MHLQKVVAGAGDGQLEEVQADAPAATRRDRQGVQQTGRRQVVCLDKLTRRAGAHVLLHSRRQAADAISAVAVFKVGTSHARPVRRSMRTCRKSWPELLLLASFMTLY